MAGGPGDAHSQASLPSILHPRAEYEHSRAIHVGFAHGSSVDSAHHLPRHQVVLAKCVR
jgi:hypothetical protein